MILTEIIESTRIALEQISASKLRSFLSTLGVVIGISVVIMMGWLIYALDAVVESTFQMMGTNMMWVTRFDWAGGKSWEEMRNRKQIKLKLAEEFKQKMNSAELVTISVSDWGGTLKYKNDDFQGMTIEGRDYNSQFTSSSELVEGRYFSQIELETAAEIIILGSKVKDAIFPAEDAVGKTIKLKGRDFLVVGVLKKQGTMIMDFVDNIACIPLNTFFSLYGRNREVDIGIKVSEAARLDEVREETRGIMRTLRNLKPWTEDDFAINESKAFEEQTQAIRASVYGVAIGMTALSFIVGIIGIMNIMFVSVTERTKEIGIRKAIGAKGRSILIQFIVEAATLCLLGAFVSLIICSGLVYAIATILPKFIPQTSFLSAILPIDLLIIASFVSLFVGIAAGLIPAMRAARLDPVDALRYE